MVHSILDAWGFAPFSQAFSALARADLAPARVISNLGARLEVVDASCDASLHASFHASGAARLAQPSGRLRHSLAGDELPTVGDWVAIAASDGDDPAVIHHVLPRRTRLVRRAVGRRDEVQVVAANVDTFLIVTSANRDASARRLERYLTAAWDSGAAPVVVVSKIDLVDPRDLAALLAELATAAPGVPIAAVSAHTGDGLDALAPYLRPGHTIALIGSSGVGKSSLVNRWLGRDVQSTLPIDDNDRGRQATTRRELFALPDGGLVVDTPGMRLFGLLDTDTGLDDAFADIAALASRCRFRDCRHRGEPGCAVDAAIDIGALDAGRRDGLHKITRELDAAERRRDPALAREARARSKAIHKALRARARVDPKLRR